MKLNSMLHLGQAATLGFTIDMAAAGRPMAYKGDRFKPDEWAYCYTELESGMIARISAAHEEREQMEHQFKSAAAKCEEHDATITSLQTHLRNVLPYAQTRFEDLCEFKEAGKEDLNFPGADECGQKVSAAYKAIGETL